MDNALTDERAGQATQRNIGVVALTLTTGAVDAVTFLHLGKVFSSVITGNMALLGVAAGSHSVALAVNGGVALAGYGVGVLIVSPIAQTPEPGQPIWPARVTAALAVELVVLAAFSAGWLLTSGRPSGVSQHVLLSLVAASMGMQSTAVRRLGQMSSTYLTSTLTGVLTALAIRRRPAEVERSLGVFAAMVAGAVAGAVAGNGAIGWVPVAILTPLAAVVAFFAGVSSRIRRAGAAQRATGTQAAKDR